MINKKFLIDFKEPVESSPAKDIDTGVNKSKDLAKEQQEIRKNRQKTEHMVAKIAKENPEMLGEKSKEIISRIDNNNMTKSKQLQEIDPSLKKKSTMNSNELQNIDSKSYK